MKQYLSVTYVTQNNVVVIYVT